jgi:ubiquinone/menaquinone biosynthesis C-methylase UbiE
MTLTEVLKYGPMDINKSDEGLQKHSRASWYKRLFARAMANSNGRYDQMVRSRKQVLLGGLHGRILEIGPGTGPNLAYYPAGVDWLGVEPNPAMFSYLQHEADRLSMKVELRESASEFLPAGDESVDAVVSTLVLCSVRDPAQTLREVLRVLRPGGKFVFLEHVAAPRATRLRSTQSLIRPIWQVFGDGCHVDRETWVTIEQAGFRDVHIEHFSLPMPIAGPQIAGFAIK